MLLKPEVLLCAASQQQCIAKLKQLPTYATNTNVRKEAAVLVPICVVNSEVCLLYTLRSSKLTTHRGQVSFPGGKIDEYEDVFQTAKRETEEEIGFSPKNIDIWSEMPRVQGRDSNMIITPVVGLLKNYDPKNLNPNTEEVAEVFTVPTKELCDTNNQGCFMFNNIVIPVYTCGKHKVWGITGVITHLFLDCFLPKDVYQPDFTRKEYFIDELLPSKL